MSDPDARADLYPLGVVLYEMLAGVAPFAGDDRLATAMAHLNDRVPKVSARVRGVPPALDRLVSDLLAKDPERRVPSAVVLRQRLDALGPLAPPTGAANGFAAFCALAMGPGPAGSGPRRHGFLLAAPGAGGARPAALRSSLLMRGRMPMDRTVPRW